MTTRTRRYPRSASTRGSARGACQVTGGIAGGRAGSGGEDLLVVLHEGERVVEVVQQLTPALVVR